MRISASDLKHRVPHRYPILLVDRVDELEPGVRIRATKAITCNEPWYRDVSDDAPLSDYAYPTPMLIESWCQSAGVLALWSGADTRDLGDKVMLFGSITEIHLHRDALPGDTLTHSVTLARATSDTFVFEGECRTGGELVLEVSSAVVTMRDRSDLDTRVP